MTSLDELQVGNQPGNPVHKITHFDYMARGNFGGWMGLGGKVVGSTMARQTYLCFVVSSNP